MHMPRRRGAQWSQPGSGHVSPSSAEALSDLRTKGSPYPRPCPLGPHLPSCLHKRPGRGQPTAPPSPPSGSQSSPNTVIMNRTPTSSAHSPGSLGHSVNTLCLSHLLSYPCCGKEGWATSLGGNRGEWHQEAARPGSPGDSVVKNSPANAGDTVRSLLREDCTCRRATKVRAPQLLSPRVKSPCSETREATAVRSPWAGTGG